MTHPCFVYLPQLVGIVEETKTGHRMWIIEPLPGLTCREWFYLGDWPLCREAAEMLLQYAINQQLEYLKHNIRGWILAQEIPR